MKMNIEVINFSVKISMYSSVMKKWKLRTSTSVGFFFAID